MTKPFQAHFSEALRLAVVVRLARELNADLTPEDVLRRVLNATAEALSTPHASIVALQEKHLLAAYALGAGQDVDARPVLERVLAEGLAGFVLHNYRTVIVNDITANPLWMALPDESLSPREGSALCVPLIHSGDVVGVMTLAHPARSYFSADAIHLINTISEMGAAALASTMRLEEARRANSRYSNLFDDVIVPVILTNLNGTIQAVNRSACEFLGYAAAELVGQNISTVHRMGTTKPLGGDRYDHLIRGQEVRFHSAVWTKGGEKQPVRVYARRIRNGMGEDYIQWIEHDLSSELALEQLRQDLSAMVYHDMRGPLGNIYTSVMALQRLLADHPNDRVADLLEVAVRSEQQVRRMVDALLDVQRLEEGSRLLSRTTTAVEELVDSALQQVQPSADEKHIQLRLALADDLPALYLDANMVERVIINLLDNAIKYTPDYGVVTVSTASSGTEVFVRIKDTGPGIPQEALEHIFDKFARVERPNMPHGVGLGLTFCKLTVEAHGGRIWVRSDPGGGSVFTFALPINAPATKELPRMGMAAW